MQVNESHPRHQRGHNSYTNDCSKKQKYRLEDIKCIATALGKPKQYRDGYMCCCPVHEDHEPSLAIWTSESYPFGLKCYANCNPKDILEAIKTRGLLPSHQPDYHSYRSHTRRLGDVMPSIVQACAPAAHDQVADQAIKRAALAEKLWHKAISPIGTPVEIYLRSRGICCDIPSTIRYLPHTLHVSTGLHYPCMLSAVTRWPDKHIIAVHRTYLSYNGQEKASVEPNKMMLGSVSGGAVRLAPMGDSNILMVGEGIETMLSIVGSYPDCAVWAVLSASNYQNLILPELPYASTIIICADHDANNAGLKVARLAAQKWITEGRCVKITIPPHENTDFNDVLRGERQ